MEWKFLGTIDETNTFVTFPTGISEFSIYGLNGYYSFSLTLPGDALTRGVKANGMIEFLAGGTNGVQNQESGMWFRYSNNSRRIIVNKAVLDGATVTTGYKALVYYR